jgi:hypothetical protein
MRGKSACPAFAGMKVQENATSPRQRAPQPQSTHEDQAHRPHHVQVEPAFRDELQAQPPVDRPRPAPRPRSSSRWYGPWTRPRPMPCVAHQRRRRAVPRVQRVGRAEPQVDRHQHQRRAMRQRHQKRPERQPRGRHAGEKARVAAGRPGSRDPWPPPARPRRCGWRVHSTSTSISVNGSRMPSMAPGNGPATAPPARGPARSAGGRARGSIRAAETASGQPMPGLTPW